MSTSRSNQIRTHRSLFYSLLTFIQILALVIPALLVAQPVQAAPAPAAQEAVTAAPLLSIVDVGAPNINCIFDADCTITVDDTVDHFTPPGATDSGFLQSRLFPVGEAGTAAAGLYGYLYRVDLRRAAAVTAQSCVTAMRIDFGPVTPIDYNGDSAPDDVFVITQGGLGNVKPASVEQTGDTLTFHFDPGVCTGNTSGNGDSSFFFGLTSAHPPRPVQANVTGTLNLNEMLDARAPRVPRTEPANIAYVFQKDTVTANAFHGLLTGEGYGVQLVPLSNVLSTDFKPFDLIIIADDTGSLDAWGDAAGQVDHIKASGKPLLGLGEGGYAYFGQLNMAIGWGNGWHRTEKDVRGLPGLSYYATPYDLTGLLGAPLNLYTAAVNEVGIHLPAPLPNVTPLGREPADDTHYPLIAERNEIRCGQLWGFSGGPDAMTGTGQRLFANAVHYGLDGCPTEQSEPEPESCFELFSPKEIPQPTLINFDDVADATVLADVYADSHGVAFADSDITRALTYGDRDADPTKALSPPNVAINDAKHPNTSSNVPMAIDFKQGQTHVGFYMGNGEKQKLSGAMVGYDAAGNVVCQVTNAPVPEEYTEFIGMHDPAGRIVRVTLDYGDTALSESIDNLYFSTGIEEEPKPEDGPERPVFNHIDRIDTEIIHSDNEAFVARFRFPAAQTWPVEGDDGQTYTKVAVPGVDNLSAAPGQPDVPVLHRLVAVPRGAEVKVSGVEVKATQYVTDVIIYPAQIPPADAALAQESNVLYPLPEPTGDESDAKIFADPPFAMDKEAYASERNFPANPVAVKRIGQLRDLELVEVSIATGQYNPAKKSLTLFEDVEFKLRFEGGQEGFLPRQRLDNPFEQSTQPIYELALNYEAITQFPSIDDIVWTCLGYEYLIVTHPDFRAAADDLKAWKQAKGISTAVVETGNGGGQIGATKEAIKEFIQSRYDHCLVRPSYVLLVGDSEFIPTYYRSTIFSSAAGTDLDYSLLTGADTLPDLALGRLPVDTLNQAHDVVDKILQYEQSPPVSISFYQKMSFAAYFQCCEGGGALPGTADRGYVETSEFVRDAMHGGAYNIERIYTTNAGGSDTPNYYNNGAPLPGDLNAASGFAWDGDTQDIVDAINDGRSLIYHRDHGSRNGWSEPSFKTSHLNQLANSHQYPVIYSINCSTGYFDNEIDGSSNSGVYFAESLLRMENAGAAGIIGATRVSPTWANNALTRGLFDATWTHVEAGYGTNTRIRRLGDIMNYGKAYMAGQIGVAQTAGSISSGAADTNYVLYHVYGDPTMELWTSTPWVIELPELVEIKPIELDIWQVRYPVEGVTITALQNGRPVARGGVENGQATLDFIADTDANKGIQLSASHPRALSTQLHTATSSGKVTPNDGGRVQDDAGTVEVIFPTAAVSVPVTLHYGPVISPTETSTDTSHSDPMNVIVHRFVLEAEDEGGNPVEQFSAEYELVVKYTDAQIEEAGLDEMKLQIAWYNEEQEQWLPIESTVDPAANTVRSRLDHFTEFALLGAVADTPDNPDQPDDPDNPDNPDQPDEQMHHIYIPLINRS